MYHQTTQLWFSNNLSEYVSIKSNDYSLCVINYTVQLLYCNLLYLISKQGKKNLCLYSICIWITWNKSYISTYVSLLCFDLKFKCLK